MASKGKPLPRASTTKIFVDSGSWPARFAGKKGLWFENGGPPPTVLQPQAFHFRKMCRTYATVVFFGSISRFPCKINEKARILSLKVLLAAPCCSWLLLAASGWSTGVPLPDVLSWHCYAFLGLLSWDSSPGIALLDFLSWD